MAQTGWWGNKMIVALSGDNHHRLKQWCIHYRKEDKYCTEQVCTCMGSSHCAFYQEKHSAGSFVLNAVPPEVPVIKLEQPSIEKAPVDSFRYIPGHHPSFGEKLLGAIVLIKNNIGHLTVGEVIFENHDIIKVEKDDGSTVKYDRRRSVSNKTFWVLDDT